MHTKGKWTVKRFEGALTDEGYSLYIESKDTAIADIVNGEDMDDNAKRIVQAVNSFDGLLGALKEAQIFIEARLIRGYIPEDSIEGKLYDRLELAIAKAEE